jgi:hypothetical protein
VSVQERVVTIVACACPLRLRDLGVGSSLSFEIRERVRQVKRDQRQRDRYDLGEGS